MTSAPERRCPECWGDSLDEGNADCDHCNDEGLQFGTWFEVSCEAREAIVSGYGIENLSVSRSLSNFHDDPSHISPELPAIRLTVWADTTGDDFLREELDADGCRHWMAHYTEARR